MDDRAWAQGGGFDDLFGPVVYARVETRKGYLALAQADAAARVAGELRRTSLRFGVEVLAYCLLPDHVHLFVAALSPAAEPRSALRRWKQLTGQAHRLRTGATLWREGCAERFLDEPGAILDGVRYLVSTPLLAGFPDLLQYRWLGLSRWTIDELLPGLVPPPRPAWWPERIIAGSRSGYSLPR
jgi:REP element-mobilizing transposase RayT